jgi:hypothetical protein
MGKRKATNSSSSSLPSSLGNLLNGFFNVKIGNTTIPKPAKKKSRTNTNTNNNKKNSTVRKLDFDNTTNNVPNTFKELLEQNEKNEKAKKNKK